MGAYKTVTDDELVKQAGQTNKATDSALTAAQQAVRSQTQALAAALAQEQSVARERATTRVDALQSAQAQEETGSGNQTVSAGSSATLTVPSATFGTQVEDYSSYLEQMYAAKTQAALAELKAAYDSNVAALDRAESGLAEEYRAARNSTAAANEVNRRNFAEYAAANGLNSGTAGQAELARSVTLQNNMNDIRTAEASARADLTLQRADTETEYNAAIAQAEYTGQYELAAALYEEKVRVQEALIDAEIRQQQCALEQYQLQYQAQQDAIANQRYESEQALALQQYQDSLALQQAAQALKEKEQADELELSWAQLTQKEQAALAEQLLAQQKYSDSLAAAEKEQLAGYGETYLKAGVMPTGSMLDAMGITAADARKYILASKTKQ